MKTQDKPKNQSEIVILLHGMWRTKGSMKPLEIFLKGKGYQVQRWSYNTFQDDVEGLGLDLFKELTRIDLDPDISAIHLVGHSLGCIVSRCALLNGKPDKIGRIVMLAPPNQGSKRATLVQSVSGDFLPVVKKLTDKENSWVKQLGTPEGLEIGIIAGSRDGTVLPVQTELDAQTDHIVVKSNHTVIMYKQIVFQQVFSFLQSGTFNHSGSA